MKMTLVSIVFKGKTVSLFVTHKKGEKVNSKIIQDILEDLGVWRGQTYGIY